MILTSLSKYRDLGLLLMRIGLGAMMILHGWPKLVGGPEVWGQLGASMSHLGISFFPVGWGFMAAIAETLGGALLLIGFCFRPATILLTCTMIVAATMHYKTSGGEFLKYAWPVELGIVFATLILIGPGRFSVDKN